MVIGGERDSACRLGPLAMVLMAESFSGVFREKFFVILAVKYVTA